MAQALPTLGRTLQDAIALQRQAPDFRSDKTLRSYLEQRLAAQFFENAKWLVTFSIRKGCVPPPLALGHATRPLFDTREVATMAKTFQWGADNKGIPAGPFADEWDLFHEWARNNDLDASWGDDHDGIGVNSWKVLLVKPSKKLGPPPDLVEGTVVVDKSRLAGFKDVQSYIEHLEARAASASAT